MDMKISTVCLGAAALVGALGYTGCARAKASESPVSAQREAIELVVYSGDFAQVREQRSLELAAGKNPVGITDVSRELDQASVLYSWGDAKDVKVDSSTYDLGIAQSEQLLQRFLGREVELVYRGENGKEGERQTGILQVATPGNVVVRVGDKFVVNPNATIETPANTGIVPVPQLSAEVQSKDAQKAILCVAYMTRGLSWSADYTATLGDEAAAMRLECWATVTNSTGVDYPDAKITFVAGSPNRAVTASRKARTLDTEMADSRWDDKMYERGAGALPAAMAPSLDSPMAVGELIAYPYVSTATIRQDQMNRVRMMEAPRAKIARDYSVRLPWNAQAPGGASDQRLKATLAINFTNDEASGLGLPLPGGAVRVYEPSGTGAPNYIGAATIADTPKGARASLTLSEVFDVYARPKLISSKRLDKKRVRNTIEVRLHNEKKTAVQIRVVQGFWGSWKVESESVKSTRPDGATAQWLVPVSAGAEVVLKFAVVLG